MCVPASLRPKVRLRLVDETDMKRLARVLRLGAEGYKMAFATPQRPRTRRLLTLCLFLFICIFALRFAVADVSEPVTLLCVVPIALAAVVLGTLGGVAAAVLSYFGFVAWALLAHVNPSLLDHSTRAVSFLLVGGLVGYFTLQAKQLEEQGTRWFELSLDIAATAGFDGFWKRANPAFTHTLGYTQEELSARPFLDFVHPEDRNATIDAATKLAGGRDVVGFQNRYRAKDGTYRWIEWACTGVVSEGLIYASGKDVTERNELEGQLRHLAQHDPLTGLFNRRRFDEELTIRLAHVSRYQSTAALLNLDLDNFKEINDTFGHAAGDDLLRAVGEIMRKTLRSTDIAARLGGDEFAVLLAEGDLGGAERVAFKLVEAMRGLADAERSIEPKVSIGIALVDPGCSSPDLVMHRADQAMYSSKWQGGDRFTFYAEVEPNESLLRLPPNKRSRVAQSTDHR